MHYGGAWCVSTWNRATEWVRACEGLHTTNVAYGGPDGRTLFIAESASGNVLMARMPVAGRPMFSPS